MTRIIAGACGGRRLETPQGDGTRPTSDRVRESLFSSLESELGGFDGLRVLDLFAGSGALGLEALSRGAASAVLVESDRRAVAAIRSNIRSLGLTGAAVEPVRAEVFVARADDLAFDLVFLDPPYAVSTEVVAGLVGALQRHAARQALFVVERATRDGFTWPEDVEALRHKKYGETTLWYGHPRGYGQ
ncbi:16S rRNA (guanine(966)-N(2))-methyltransferase RsmD [Aeromicrobium sp. CF3.5]|uniref:16S rRNA (guanine(966)-N(2))-methyltransferase RsmD n=1 Tax=Aeromicrobium sp. CF3.5 TaxID=3373078 RepID=UPI003EE6008D